MLRSHLFCHVRTIATLRTWHFEATEDIMTKSNIEKLVRVATLTLLFLPSGFWNISILLHKQATQSKHFCLECILKFWLIFACWHDKEGDFLAKHIFNLDLLGGMHRFLIDDTDMAVVWRCRIRSFIRLAAALLQTICYEN